MKHSWTVVLIVDILIKGFVFSNIGSQNTNLNINVTQIILVSLPVLALVIYLWKERIAKPRSDNFISKRIDIGLLFIVVWFLLMLMLTRGAMRFSFFLASPILALCSYGFIQLQKRILSNAQIRIYTLGLVFFFATCEILLLTYYHTTGSFSLGVWNRYQFYILVLMLVSAVSVYLASLRWNKYFVKQFCMIVLSLTIAVPFFNQTAESIKLTKSGFGIDPQLNDTLNWANKNLPQDAVLAAWWDYGSRINYIGRKSTIIDEEQIIPYWIYLMARYVFCGLNSREALEFLKSHSATHLLIGMNDLKRIQPISYTGSDEKGDRLTDAFYFSLADRSPVSSHVAVFHLRNVSPNILAEKLRINNILSKSWCLMDVFINLKKVDNDYVIENARAHLATEHGNYELPINQVFFRGRSIKLGDEGLPGIFVFSSNGGIYLPEKASNFLMSKLLIDFDSSPYFKEVYSSQSIEQGHINGFKIFEIIYPEDIEIQQDYLKTTFPSKALFEAWKGGK